MIKADGDGISEAMGTVDLIGKPQKNAGIAGTSRKTEGVLGSAIRYSNAGIEK